MRYFQPSLSKPITSKSLYVVSPTPPKAKSRLNKPCKRSKCGVKMLMSERLIQNSHNVKHRANGLDLKRDKYG